jgi:cytochrome b6-f complex iron-sulfur subunit
MQNEGRRIFLGTSLGALAAASVAAVLYPVFRYLSPVAGAGSVAKITFSDKDLQEGDARFFEFAGSSAVLVRKSGGELVAFSAVCTHLGCIVQWEKQKQSFLCPCHAGLYSADGKVVSGPPPKPLARIPLAVANGVITVG